MFTVIFEVSFQSSCAYPAKATFCDETKFVVEMLPLSRTPKRADAIASPVRLLTLDPLEALLPEGNAVSLLLKPRLPCGSGTWKNGNFTERNSNPNL